MKYFLDTEFIEDGATIELLSIGIISEYGHQLYFENLDADLSKASDWVRENVLPHLKYLNSKESRNYWVEENSYLITGPRSKSRIAESVVSWITHLEKHQTFQDEIKPEFWGYYANYDWVLFCQLFGTMMDLPRPFPMFINDVKSFQSVLRPDLVFPRQGEQEHNALADARHIKLMHSILFGDHERVKAD